MYITVLMHLGSCYVFHNNLNDTLLVLYMYIHIHVSTCICTCTVCVYERFCTFYSIAYVYVFVGYTGGYHC